MIFKGIPDETSPFARLDNAKEEETIPKEGLP